jgi:alpha-L-arabinofuranosidase
MDIVTGIATCCKSVSSGLTCIQYTCIRLTRSEFVVCVLISTALTNSVRHYANVTSPRAAERAIEITASLIDLARCEINMEPFPDTISTKARSRTKPTICFDEWNVWDPVRAPGDKGAEQLYDLSDMLAVAVWLNVFIRQAKYIGMATIAQSVNVISPLMTTERGVIKQTTYWPLLLFSKYMRGKSLATHVRATSYTGRTFPEFLASTVDLPLLDVSAALSDDGCMNLAVVNNSEIEAMETVLPPLTGPVQVFTVGGKSNQIRDVNVEGSEKVSIRESKWDGKGKFTFEKHSFTLLRWKAQDAASTVLLNGHLSP